MAVKLSANYSKKLGLPAYSSHSFSASVEVELTDISQVEAEVQKLYQLLQHSVDQEIQSPGFVPQAQSQGGHGNGDGRPQSNVYHGSGANGHRPASQRNNGERWNCTDGQRGFILRLVNEHNMDKEEVERLAVQLFGVGVKGLNRLQASGLIDHLLDKAGKPRPARWQQQAQPQTTEVS